MREVRRDYPDIEVTDSTGSEEVTKIVPGVREPGLRGVRIDYIAYDKGTVAGTAVAKGQFKALPGGDHGGMGGNAWHTFATLDTYQQNRIFFGHVLAPGEDLELVAKLNTAAATARFRVGRTLIFD
jgi:hypothetical protein